MNIDEELDQKLREMGSHVEIFRNLMKKLEKEKNQLITSLRKKNEKLQNDLESTQYQLNQLKKEFEEFKSIKHKNTEELRELRQLKASILEITKKYAHNESAEDVKILYDFEFEYDTEDTDHPLHEDRQHFVTYNNEIIYAENGELNLSDKSISRLSDIEGLFEMEDLEILNLSHNDLSEIPQNIGNLKHIKEINLSDNNLRNLPDTIMELSELNTLNLRNNKLISIPSYIVEQSDVRVLLDGNDIIYIPLLKEKLADVISRNIRGTESIDFGDFIRKECSLPKYNDFFERVSFDVDAFISYYSDLQDLCKSTLENHWEECRSIVGKYVDGDHRNFIQSIYIEFLKTCNLISDRPYEPYEYILLFINAKIYEEVSFTTENGEMCELKIHGIPRKDILHHFGFVPKISTLQNLECIGCDLKDTDIDEFLSSSTDRFLSSITHITFDNNTLTRIPSIFENFSNLNHLSMNDNYIKSFEPFLGKLQKLQSLHLFNNFISTIPEYMTKMDHLSDLWIENNNFNYSLNYRGSPKQINDLITEYDNKLTLLERKLESEHNIMESALYQSDSIVQKIRETLERDVVHIQEKHPSKEGVDKVKNFEKNIEKAQNISDEEKRRRAVTKELYETLSGFQNNTDELAQIPIDELNTNVNKLLEVAEKCFVIEKRKDDLNDTLTEKAKIYSEDEKKTQQKEFAHFWKQIGTSPLKTTIPRQKKVQNKKHLKFSDGLLFASSIGQSINEINQSSSDRINPDRYDSFITKLKESVNQNQQYHDTNRDIVDMLHIGNEDEIREYGYIADTISSFSYASIALLQNGKYLESRDIANLGRWKERKLEKIYERTLDSLDKNLNEIEIYFDSFADHLYTHREKLKQIGKCKGIIVKKLQSKDPIVRQKIEQAVKKINEEREKNDLDPYKGSIDDIVEKIPDWSLVIKATLKTLCGIHALMDNRSVNLRDNKQKLDFLYNIRNLYIYQSDDHRDYRIDVWDICERNRKNKNYDIVQDVFENLDTKYGTIKFLEIVLIIYRVIHDLCQIRFEATIEKYHGMLSISARNIIEKLEKGGVKHLLEILGKIALKFVPYGDLVFVIMKELGKK